MKLLFTALLILIGYASFSQAMVPFPNAGVMRNYPAPNLNDTNRFTPSAFLLVNRKPNFYVWDDSTTAKDDSMNIIRPSGRTAGAWVLGSGQYLVPKGYLTRNKDTFSVNTEAIAADFPKRSEMTTAIADVQTSVNSKASQGAVTTLQNDRYRLYNKSGAVTQPLKIWADSVQLTGDGQTFDISSAGFTYISYYNLTTADSSSLISNVPQVKLKLISTGLIKAIIGKYSPIIVPAGVSGVPQTFQPVVNMPAITQAWGRLEVIGY